MKNNKTDKTRIVQNAIQSLGTSWQARSRYAFQDMPNLLLIIIGGCSLIVTAGFGPVLREGWIEFWQIAQTMPPLEWGGKGYLFFGVLVVFSLYTAFFSAMGGRCTSIISARVFR